MIFKLMLGFYCALSISVIAWWRKSLDVGGMIAATISGTVIFGLGGVGPSVALVAFFLSGSFPAASEIQPIIGWNFSVPFPHSKR